MGVQARVVLWSADERDARAAARAAFERLDRLDRALSDWRADGELARLERAGAGRAIVVDDDLFRCLERARLFAAASGGAFDPTIGPVVRLWRSARATGRPPDPAALAAARARVDWSALELDPARRTVRLPLPEMELDLGGIAKGFAADEALATLADRGHLVALVDVGGDLALGAPPPDQPGWRVRVPTDGSVRALAHVGVATSGDAEQFLEVEGQRWSHIADARTGWPLVDSPTVTVIAADATSADALASAISVLGIEEGARWIERFPGAVLVASERTAVP